MPLPVIRALPANISNDPAVRAACPAAARRPVPDEGPIQVELPPAPPFSMETITRKSWRKPPNSDPTFQMKYRGLVWIPPLARRAAEDGRLGAITALIQQVVLFHVQNPDPQTNRHGWDEGTAQRRLESENCLYALTGSPALVPAMAADVAVLTGKRYYGPPNSPVHNHGLMANLHMITAGELVNRPEWTRTAVTRIVAEAPRAFSAQGVSHEQASFYQAANARLWEAAAAALESLDGYAEEAKQIRETVDKAERVLSFMTEPDGNIVQVGDSDIMTGRPGAAGDDLVLRDDETGWMIGRNSWTDRDATHYTVRYGPKRWAHGQENRAGGVTWSARGARVLVGTGRYSYDTTDAYGGYRRDPASQNVATPAVADINSEGTSTLTGTFDGPVHEMRVTDTVYGVPHTRQITVGQKQARLVVTDSFTDSPAWSQHWHLDPKWVLTSGGVGEQRLTFRHATGRKLSITTTGRISAVWHGEDAIPYGWVFPRFRTKAAAYQLKLDNVAGAPIRTTFLVS